MDILFMIVGSIGVGIYSTEVMSVFLPINTFGWGVAVIAICVILLFVALAPKEEKHYGGAVWAVTVGVLTFMIAFTHMPASTLLKEDWVTITAALMVAVGHFFAA